MEASSSVMKATGVRDHFKESSSEVIREGLLLPSKDSWSLCFDRNLTLKIHLNLDWEDHRSTDQAVKRLTDVALQSADSEKKHIPERISQEVVAIADSTQLHSRVGWDDHRSTNQTADVAPVKPVKPVKRVRFSDVDAQSIDPESKQVLEKPTAGGLDRFGWLCAAADSWLPGQTAEEKAKKEAEEMVAAEAARRATEEKAKKEIEERARKEAEEKVAIAAEAARKAAEEKAAAETARKAAEAKAKKEADERARKEAEEKFAAEAARKAAEAKAKQEAEERARKEAEEKAAAEAARKEAEEKAKKEAEERARKEAEEKAAAEAARKEAKEKAKKEAEERARKEAEEKAAAEAARKAAETKAKKEAEEKARKETEEKAAAEAARKAAEDAAKKEAEERARKEAEEKAAAEAARKAAEDAAKKEVEERARKEDWQMRPSVSTWLGSLRMFDVCRQAQKTREKMQQQHEIISAIQQHHHASRLELWQIQPSIGTSRDHASDCKILKKAREMLEQMEEPESVARTSQPSHEASVEKDKRLYDAEKAWNLKPSVGTWYAQKSQWRVYTPSWQQPSVATWLSKRGIFEIHRKVQQASAKAHVSSTRPRSTEQSPDAANSEREDRSVSPSALFGSWSQKHARTPQEHLRSVANMIVASQAFAHPAARLSIVDEIEQPLRQRSKSSVASLVSQHQTPQVNQELDPLALHFAAVNGDVAEVQLLLRMRVNPNTIDEHGIVPMHLAVDGGHQEIVGHLISASATVNAATVGQSPDTHAITPLHAAANRGAVPIAIRLLAANALPGSARGDGVTPLHFVAQGGHLNMLHVLLASDTSVAAKSLGGFTPLHDASFGGYADVVSVLLSARALPNAETDSGTTPLHVAAQRDHQAVMTHLLAHGAMPDIASAGGFTPLHDAAHGGHLLAVSQLLQANATVDVTSGDGATALHFAAQAGYGDVVGELLSAGACVEAPLGNGMLSPLHLAAKRGHIHVVRMLRKSNRLAKEMHRRHAQMTRERSREGRIHITRASGARSRSRSSSTSRCRGARSSREQSELSFTHTPSSRPYSSLGRRNV